jgi:hypothetical protein
MHSSSSLTDHSHPIAQYVGSFIPVDSDKLIMSLRNLLNFLSEKDILATFFVVGSRVIERPTVLVEEYMRGHEVSVHTWSHKVCSSAGVIVIIH